MGAWGLHYSYTIQHTRKTHQFLSPLLMPSTALIPLHIMGYITLSKHLVCVTSNRLQQGMKHEASHHISMHSTPSNWHTVITVIQILLSTSVNYLSCPGVVWMLSLHTYIGLGYQSSGDVASMGSWVELCGFFTLCLNATLPGYFQILLTVENMFIVLSPTGRGCDQCDRFLHEKLSFHVLDLQYVRSITYNTHTRCADVLILSFPG